MKNGRRYRRTKKHSRLMGINDGKFTYEQDAMTDQEVIAWKMDEIPKMPNVIKRVSEIAQNRAI